ncbi:MAG: Stk1 family PASTA domain-containing Ser/Thr kinase [Anaerovoracaceae bacterium]|nr:Stk1 family PASTA domain-containing Ser/Thr kinase [Bacillota bacterium]MDY2670087.1 Stk1 family PASTA domain-containing Ser/Thr kinase [Anaerovoracaceae bacterium]
MSSKVLAGRYDLLEKMGDGGMAVVYKGKDRLLNRYVAIKILKPEFIRDPKFIENFRRESQAAARLSDPNIVSVYDVGHEGNIHYIVMELLEGSSLGDLIKSEAPFSEERTIELTKQIASGLSAAHKKKIVHRDIKPHNILMTAEGVPKIADFGIAKAVNGATIVNSTTTVMGSVHYLSPEQAKGGYVDVRTDIYSLGIVMYEMLTGKVPFDGDNAVSVAMMHINSDVPAPSKINHKVSRAMDEIVMKAAARSPEQRYRSADELIKALDDAKKGIGRRTDDSTKVFGLNDFYSVNPNPPKSYDDGYGIDDFITDSYYKTPAPTEPLGPVKQRTAAPIDDDIFDDKRRQEELAARRAAREAKNARKKKKKKSSRRMKALAIVLALICAIPLSMLMLHAINGIGADKVEVPDLVGMTEEQAYEELTEKGLKYDLAASVESDKYDDGEVVSTDPSAGKKVEKGTTVMLTLARSPDEEKSSGSKAVPDVRELTLTDAKDTIKEQGFSVGNVAYKASDSVEKGTVISQSPGAGTKAKEGSSISIVVSSGPEEKTVEMPAVTGVSESAARSAVAKAGLSVGSVSEEYSDEPVGTVIRQGISAGTSVKKGESVSLVVSKGRKPSTSSDSSDNSGNGSNSSGESASGSSDSSDSSGSDDNSGKIVDDNEQNAEAQSYKTVKYNIDYGKASNDPFSLTVTMTSPDGTVRTIIPTKLCFKSQKSKSVSLTGKGTCVLNVMMDRKTYKKKINFS